MTTDNQRVHYERIHDRYQKHYYDRYSNYYRSKLYLNKLSREFQGKKIFWRLAVAEAQT